MVPGIAMPDASGERVLVPARPGRIVSLVPSVTESLFALGLGNRVVGVTDWCVHPAAGVAGLTRVGGTKNPDLAAVVALEPDLVLANLEENRALDIRRLRGRGLSVWVDHPRTVAEAAGALRALARLGAAGAAAGCVVAPLERALAEAAATPPPRLLRGFVAVWKDPWMTLSADTYASDLLRCAGIANVFADAAGRYPRVSPAEIAARDPEVVLLPDEPYRFTPDDARALAGGDLAGTAAARAAAVRVLDGTLVFWHGPRTARGLVVLRALADEIRSRIDASGTGPRRRRPPA